MTDPIADPIVGRTIAHYDVLARVGGGGMGVVYRARDTRLGRVVALKFLPQQWSHDEAARQRFVREAQAASATNHPNICTIHDIETAPDGQLFIVMAYYEGQTLKQRLESGTPIPIDEALDIATQIADGLAKAHAQGVVHRDVKPGNVILTDDGVRILDFGLATFADALKLTIENSTLGTAAYMSPEQVRGQSADPRSDVWAVGVILYEMLTGHVPFQGSHAEAIAYAIRNEAPHPLRGARPGIGEGVEQLVFRALHKEAAIRYQSGRELARALRQVRGQSMPLDLRTEAVPLPVTPTPLRPVPPRPRKILPALAATTLVLVSVGLVWWASAGNRTPVVVAPVSNLTGDTDLDQYRLALTQRLVRDLEESKYVSPVAYTRMLEPLRRFVDAGEDASSREAIQALARATGVDLVVVPTLHFEDRVWRARVALLDVTTMTNVDQYESAPTVSMLGRDTAWKLVTALAPALEERLAPRLRRFIGGLPALVGLSSPDRSPGPQQLDSAKAFEEGTRSYHAFEFAAARRAFAAAAKEDSRNPMPLVWQSRAALSMRQDADAADAVERAMRLLTPETPVVDSLLAQAVDAEVREDYVEAEARYRALIDEDPDNSTWVLELGALLERRNRFADAAALYHELSRTDPRAARPHLELCRLYSPSRLNEAANAVQQGERALRLYQELGSRPGEVQARLCLVDTLRMGEKAGRDESRAHAASAAKMLDDLRFEYQPARAQYYIALAAGATGDMPGAFAGFEKSLELARRTGNAELEPLLLMNLGVASVALGNTARAAGFYQQSVERYRALRNESRAAQILANRGAMLIEQGPQPAEGLRDVQNAMKMFQALGDTNFEVFCLQVTAAYYRHVGDHQGAERELNKALTIARGRSLADEIGSLTIDIARSRLEMADYEAALARLLTAVGDGSSPRSAEARIWLARVHTRRGQFGAADEALRAAESDARASIEGPLRMLLEIARGELAVENGHPQDADAHFARVAGAQSEGAADELGIEARAALGLLEGERGRQAEAEDLLRAALRDAQRLNLVGLQGWCRVHLARMAVRGMRFKQALVVLEDVPEDLPVGPEVRMQVHYWRGRALLGAGSTVEGERELAAARAMAGTLRDRIPEAERAGFASRPVIRMLLGAQNVRS